MSISASTFLSKKQDLPILIVDKVGELGEKLATLLNKQALVIFVSSKKIDLDNVVHVPFVKSVPTIPDNSYSHIFVIDEYGKISNSFIGSFLDKAEHDASRLVLVTNKQCIDEKFVRKYVSFYKNAKLIVLGDIFSKDILFDPSTDINKFIKQIKTNRQIEVGGDGTRQTEPVFIDDAIDGILQIGFVENDSNNYYWLMPKNRPTLLTLAHIFQKQNPDIKIDFVKAKKTKIDKNILPEGQYLFGEDYDLVNKIKKLDLSLNTIAEIKRIKEQKGIVYDFKLKYLFSATILIIGFFILIPLLSTALFSGLGIYSLQNLKTNIQNQKLNYAKNDAIMASQFLSYAKLSTTLLIKEARVIGKEAEVEQISDRLDQGIELSNSAGSLLSGVDKLKSLFSKSTNDKEEFLELLQNLKTSLITYQKQKENGNIPKSIDEKLGGIIRLGSTTIDLWPEILGFNKPKTYMVLLQNNMELRPTGGFIGSYGILKLDSGRVKDFKIYDVYDADGQLKTHVEPPFAVRRYLPSVNWYLRDSNFDIDFSKSAAASAVFLNSEMNQAVDGVMAVDLSFVKSILSATGPVKVLDYNETVNADNLLRVVTAHVEDNFFPGSTQKKDFLNALYKSLQAKLNEDKNLAYTSLIKSLSDSIFEKHILFAFNNVALQSVFSVNGWGSTLLDTRKKSETIFNDYFGINEANLGANKVNYYISRSVSQNIIINDKGQVTQKIQISFKNNAPTSLGKKGFYKSYLRLLTPAATKLVGLKINDTVQNITPAITNPIKYEAKNFIPPVGFEVDQQNEEGKTIFGFLNSVEASSLKKIELTFDMSDKINLLKPEFIYDLKLYKQPGIDNFPYVLSVSFPETFRLVNASDKFKTEGARAYMSKDVLTDQRFVLNLAKK